ncbi:hypothetical protein L615_007000000110 [Nocardioides sp. J9]|uniref:hypothetical protein n=1 Tax=Nocardioides sp. J9 TaxID=935844 RepID=UPI0011A3E63D|nr:hypothetical protein [Nocardioides sp. J9]TWG92500.1 hypothetical protein L615_007000000110 [Nocardioides sp. J9]
MSTAARLAGFGAVAVVVFAVALLVGKAAGPVGAGEPAPTHDTHAGAPDVPGDGDHRVHVTPASGAGQPGGLQTARDGYALRLADDRAEAGPAVPVRFTITGPDGEPVTSYDVQHEKQLHLIAVRRDLTGFQHVHPVLRGDTWTTELALTPGSWRIFADFKATGAAALTLGTDLAVDGDFRAATPRGERRTSGVDGYRVTLDGDLSAGADAQLALSVSKDGEPVTDLEPYLGAYGHLVALRAGDLAYLHVHPDGEPGDGTTEPGPEVVFHTTVPSDGTYHLYLDFKHDGVVRTATFTIGAGGTAHGADGAVGHEGDEHGESSGHTH